MTFEKYADKIYMFGGVSTSNYFNDVWILNLTSVSRLMNSFLGNKSIQKENDL